MTRVLVAAACAVVLAAGCGDDEEDTADTGSTPATQTEPTTTTEPERPAETTTTPEEEVEPGPSPEEQPGGAGDEEPAQSQAAFTGRAGRITPRLVRVPPFISIRIELRSADGGRYGLSCGGRDLRVDAEIASASTRVAGRRPGDRLRCAPLGAHNGVAVSASAEPGP